MGPNVDLGSQSRLADWAAASLQILFSTDHSNHIITAREAHRFRQILSDHLKLTGKFRLVKVRLRAVKSFM